MYKSIFAIYDIEEEYAYRLMDYVNLKKNNPFFVQAFTNINSLVEFGGNNYIDILLISSVAMNDKIEQLNIGSIIILSDGEVVRELHKYPLVYKYQSSESIIREVMNYYAEQKEDTTYTCHKGKVKVIGIYSPLRRCLKTSFAMTLGQILSKDKSAIYINMEEFSGLSKLLNKEYQSDLADAIYFLNNNPSNFAIKLRGIVNSLNNLDYIPPVRCPEDMRKIKSDDIIALVNSLINDTEYEAIVLDIDNYIENVTDILNVCTLVYMPVKEDAVSIAKIEEFRDYITGMEMAEVLERIREVKLPYHASFGAKEYYIDKLIWGELGDYVRNLVKAGDL